LNFIGNLCRVVFQRVGDDNIAGANISEALSVLFRLGKNHADFAEDIPCERFYFLIPGVTFVADSTVDHNNGNTRALCEADKIRPDFQFHQQADRGPDIAEGATHRPRKIKWKIDNLVVPAENITRPGKAGISGRADDNFEITEPGFKLFDYCFGRVNLANTDGVKPDTFFFRASPADLAETLSPAGPVAPVPDGPIYDHRAIGKTG